MTHTQNITLPEAQRGPAERLLDVVLSSSAHLWHNRPGVDAGGKWHPALARRGKPAPIGTPVKAGLFVPAATALYRQLLEIYQLNADLMAHFASYALVETDWRDLKVACAALMLVQSKSGQPVRGDGGAIEFLDDDYRTIGEAMILHYEKGSKRMFTPKGVLRVAELLEVPEIAALNRAAGFADPASKKAPLGRWPSVARQWLAIREKNPPLLVGLVKAGMKETIKKLARKCGYKPEAQAFFEILGWQQKQSDAGHRKIGLEGLNLAKAERFDGLGEAEICERIVGQKLTYKEVVGRLPKEVGLTPAIMMTLLPSLSDRDLRMMTPTLESLGLLDEPEVKVRWEKALKEATDQRAINIAKNVRSKELREKLEEAADEAVKKAVVEASKDAPIEVMFLIDKSGSMEKAIEQSKEVLSRILSGFPLERMHIATFDTMGTVIRPKAASRAAVQHMLKDIRGEGGTMHGAGVLALHANGFRVPAGSKLVVIVVGDEAGESGTDLAGVFGRLGYQVAAVALILCTTSNFPRGETVRGLARALNVPYSEISSEHFEDPYQVPRVLRTLLEAPTLPGITRSGWLEKVMKTPLLQKPV